MNDHTDGPKRLIDRPDDIDRPNRTATRQNGTGLRPNGIATVPPASLVLVVAGVLTQIAYPLLFGPALRAATIVSVLLLAAAALTHAGATRGRSAALIVLVVAGGLGLAAETIGVHTGFPFGAYAYADSLGPRLFGVPLVVPLAWTMLAYPCLLLGRRLTRSGNRVRTALAGGVGLAGWDLFLDPQMVAQGHWSWVDPTPALPGVPGVPLTNYAGWLLVSVLLIAVLDRSLPPLTGEVAENGTRSRHFVQDHGEIVPAAVLAWTWCGSAVGNLVFFDRPWVALYGGLAMGAVVLPYLLQLRAASMTPPTTQAEEAQP
jgi:carotene biosynthesis associated membrane protein